MVPKAPVGAVRRTWEKEVPETMGDGTRPQGHFSYAALRYKEVEPDCLNDFTRCPGRDLCERCVHTECSKNPKNPASAAAKSKKKEVKIE